MNNKNILLRSKIVSGWSYFVLILLSALTELSSWRLDVFLLCIRLCAHPKPKRPTLTTLLRTMEVKFFVLHWGNYSSHFALRTWRDMGRKFSTESAPIALYLSFGARKVVCGCIRFSTLLWQRWNGRRCTHRPHPVCNLALMSEFGGDWKIV